MPYEQTALTIDCSRGVDRCSSDSAILAEKKQDAENDRSPVRSLQVEVAEKREVLAPNRRSRQREEIVAEEKRYEVYFQPLLSSIDASTDSKIKMIVPQQEFNRIEQGAKGTLRLQGTRYIGFAPN